MFQSFPLQRGFTLVEMMVVVAVLGLAMTLISMSGPPGGGGQTLRHEVAELAGGLREARSLAIADNRTVAVTVDLADRQWKIADGQTHPLPADAEIRFLIVSERGGGPERGRIHFFPDGSATGGRIDFLENGRHFQIAIDWLSGRVDHTEMR